MVLTIVMLDTRTDLEVRKILYAELRKIRQNNIRYNQYFDALVTTRLSEGAERVFQRLLRARMRVPYVEKNRPVGLPRPHRARPLARIVLRARNIARKLFRSK